MKKANEGISIETSKGSLIFISKNSDKMIEDLQKTYGQTYRKSIAFDKKGGKNESTSEGSKTMHKAYSMIVGFNR